MLFSIATLSLAFVVLVSATPVRRQGGGVITQCSVPNTAAITFDDGPGAFTKDIVDILDSKKAKGTFFVNGANGACIYDDTSVDHIQYAYGKGHQIASHSWAHADLATLGKGDVLRELTLVDDALEKIIGVVPSMMRPPFGSVNDVVLEAAAENGQLVVNWNYDTRDALGASPEESLAVYGEAAGTGSPILILSHETIETTSTVVLAQAIDTLQGAGYKLVTVAECLGASAYSKTGKRGSRDDSWTC
ncbi:carbohydrate esterase family 4 protein [Cylindrobasidium torrendii FP15055 ss-10]|uniref:Carbohydrate esterase family 4 protein n=1 Tax=Cylindrobasidium torrendii FP15055 ss-10 TaxID=1314674 RepID=A0A0D7AUY4_9AGAR|nr:carbohydrate esterase family 4 protein [Cylindrobasidium torrendii FP15055 ss-10]